MKTTHKPKFLGLILTGMLTIFSLTAFGQTTKTVKGEILDMSCYMSHGAKGKGHKACAQKCLDKGLPAGILSDNNDQVYLLVEDHKKSDVYKKAIEHAADDIKVTGKMTEKNGMKALVVEKVEVEG